MRSGKQIQSHRELQVYQMAFQGAMRVYELTRYFPREECCSRQTRVATCDNILGKLVSMIHNPSPWLIRVGEPWG
jgi:hypothetical protein